MFFLWCMWCTIASAMPFWAYQWWEATNMDPFWTGPSNQSWMFPLPNRGQNIGDHVAPPFLSLAPDPTNSCDGTLMMASYFLLTCSRWWLVYLCGFILSITLWGTLVDFHKVSSLFVTSNPQNEALVNNNLKSINTLCSSLQSKTWSTLPHPQKQKEKWYNIYPCVDWRHCEVLNTFEYFSYSCFNFVACPPKRLHFDYIANHEYQVVWTSLYLVHKWQYDCCHHTSFVLHANLCINRECFHLTLLEIYNFES